MSLVVPITLFDIRAQPRHSRSVVTDANNGDQSDAGFQQIDCCLSTVGAVVTMHRAKFQMLRVVRWQQQLTHLSYFQTLSRACVPSI